MSIFNKVLFRLVKHSSKQKHRTQKHRTGTVTTDTQSELLKNINRYTSLIRLQDERQLIEVFIKDYTDSFQSMILGVDLYNQCLLIDDFSPSIHNREALIGHSIKIRHQHQRQMLLISSEVLNWEEESQSFILTLPKDVHYQPRRQETRVYLSGNIPLSATINPLYGSPWYASITNISIGGMRIVVTGDLRKQLHKHKLVKHCEIMLDKDTSITCQGRIKSFSCHARPYRRTEVSIAFESLSEENTRQLQSFIERLSLAA